MVNEARFRPAISANAYVDAPNRALLIGSYSPDNLPRRRRRGAVRGALSCGCAASVPSNFPNGIRASVCCCLQPSVSFARQRTSAAASARHRGEKIYWSAQRPPKGVARSAAAAAVNGGEGITEAARGWVGPGAPRELRYDSRAPVPVTVNRGCYRHAEHVSPNLSQQTAESGLTTHASRELILW